MSDNCQSFRAFGDSFKPKCHRTKLEIRKDGGKSLDVKNYSVGREIGLNLRVECGEGVRGLVEVVIREIMS